MFYHLLFYFYFVVCSGLRYSHAVFAHITMITCTPDTGVALPFDGMDTFAGLKERAAAACETINILIENGLPPSVLDPTQTDRTNIQAVIDAFAADEEKTNQALTTTRLSSLTPAALYGVHETLKDFSHVVVKNAVQIRHLVTNKLILETQNADPRVRIKALELLGKISDVGLFTERSEVTVTHRSTEDLKLTLREKLQQLREKTQPSTVEDVEITELAQNTVDISDELAELGILQEEKPE